MHRQTRFGYALVAGLLLFFAGAGVALALTAAPPLLAGDRREGAGGRGRTAAGEAIIADHTSTDISAVPQEWIEEAKEELHIAYGHTSHGSQLVTGMAGLVNFANGGGLGLDLPHDLFVFNEGGTGGALDLREPFGTDAGYYPEWVDETTDYLGAPDPVTGRGTRNPEINVVMWAWCGQVSDYTEQQMLDDYLLPMTGLEAAYPGIVFVYMTGHADGTGEEGNLHVRNRQIRDYCAAHGKVLYDFYHVELYDPDNSYFGDKAVTDECYYDADGNGTRERNWAVDWQNEHIEDQEWYTCDCVHSKALNCNQKAYAAWWLWARLAGWSEVEPGAPRKVASTGTAVDGQTVGYTITVQNVGAPLGATVYLTDEVPAGLSYVPGSLSSTAGAVDDGDAPVLHWVGQLSPNPVVTVTYAAVVDVTEDQAITNHALVASPGYDPFALSATITAIAPEQPDLAASFKTAYPSRASFGEQITYTIVVRSSAGPVADTASLTDTIPAGLAYVPETLTSSTGLVSDAQAPTLRWSGVLSPTSVVTVTYNATVSTTETAAIRNAAILALSGRPDITRTATILVNPYRLYLPLVLRAY